MGKLDKLTIVGAGPVGLACAYYAQKRGLDFEIFESSDSYGGNCKTFEIDGFRFDSGAHRLHDKIDDVTEDWKSILGSEIQSIEKPSKIIDGRREFDFPLSPLNLLGNLSFKEIITSVFQFVLYKKKDDSFSEQARYNYTPVLANKFLLNYSKKLWGVNPDELLPEVSGGRLNGLSFFTMIKEFFLGNNKKTEHLDGRFFYPRKGIQQLMDEIVSKVSDKIVYNSPLEGVNVVGKTIKNIVVGGKDKPVSFLINSAPLHLLMKSEKPEFRHLILMTICLNREQIGDVATYYFPDEKYKFTRVVEPSVRSVHMAPKGKTSLMIEIPVTEFNSLDKKVIKLEIVSQLIEAQFFVQSEVLGINFFDLPNAYPVLSTSNKGKMDKVLLELEKINNLKTFGRSGGFTYVHLHDIFKFAKNCVDDYAKIH